MKPLEILSYNIEMGKKFEDLLAWIDQAEISPDIFCFQEFPENKLPEFETFLKKRGYEYRFTRSIILRKVQIGELTAFKQESLKLVRSTDIALGNYIWERGYRAFKGQRSALLTAFSYGGLTFSVANIHLSVLSPHSMRYKQLKLVIEELTTYADNAIIVGDFNYTSLFGVKRLFRFMQTYGFTCVGEKMITHKIFKRIPQQLDYVFQKGFTPIEMSVHKVPHSDHLPLHVQMSLV